MTARSHKSDQLWRAMGQLVTARMTATGASLPKLTFADHAEADHPKACLKLQLLDENGQTIHPSAGITARFVFRKAGGGATYAADCDHLTPEYYWIDLDLADMKNDLDDDPDTYSVEIFNTNPVTSSSKRIWIGKGECEYEGTWI